MKLSTSSLTVGIWAVAALFSATAYAATPPTYPLVNCSSSAVLLAPLGTSADAANIQTRIDAGGIVYLGSGVFTLNATLQLKSNVTLCGSQGTVLRWTPPGAPGHIVEGPMVGLTNASIYNITFDHGAVVLPSGTTVNIKSNVFKNMLSSGVARGTFGDYGWVGLQLVDVTGGTVSQNIFQNINSNAIAAWRLVGTTIANNWINNVYQGMSLVDSKTTVVDGNVGYAIERMGIEMIASGAAVAYSGNEIKNNQLYDFVPYDGNCAPDGAHNRCIEGISMVAGTSARLTKNIVVCGAGCAASTRGYGLEVSGLGTTEVSGNTVRGFREGTVVAVGQTMKIKNNSYYDVTRGISRSSVTDLAGIAYTSNNLNIELNQIENAIEKGIDGDWTKVTQTTIKDNLITRKADAAKDAGAAYIAVHLTPVAPGAPALSVTGNKIIFEGPLVPTFVANGFFINGNGVAGSMAGLTLDGNWVAAVDSAAYGYGVNSYPNGSSLNVNLYNNCFQNLTQLSLGDTSYLVSNNLAVLLAGGSLATTVTVPGGLPAVTASASPSTLSTNPTTYVWFTSSLSGQGVAPVTAWYLGDGGTVSGLTGGGYTYRPGTSMLARVVSKHSSGALLTTKVAITSP